MFKSTKRSKRSVRTDSYYKKGSLFKRGGKEMCNVSKEEKWLINLQHLYLHRNIPPIQLWGGGGRGWMFKFKIRKKEVHQAVDYCQGLISCPLSYPLPHHFGSFILFPVLVWPFVHRGIFSKTTKIVRCQTSKILSLYKSNGMSVVVCLYQRILLTDEPMWFSFTM